MASWLYGDAAAGRGGTGRPPEEWQAGDDEEDEEGREDEAEEDDDVQEEGGDAGVHEGRSLGDVDEDGEKAEEEKE